MTGQDKQTEQDKRTGRLIVFEGADGCGKTTQLRYCYDWLRAQRFPQAPDSSQIILTQEPGATVLGRTLRKILLTSPEGDEGVEPTAELLLYAADRAQHVQHILKPKLAQGCWILCDRHIDSTVAYQGFGRGLDQSLIQQLNSIATVGLVSDLTLWLDLPVEVSRSRLATRGQADGLRPAPQDRMERLGLDFHHRVYQGFEWLAGQYPERIVRVDASGSEAEVAERVQRTICDRLGLHPNSPHPNPT